jgi:hypothetical protein
LVHLDSDEAKAIGTPFDKTKSNKADELSRTEMASTRTCRFGAADNSLSIWDC